MRPPFALLNASIHPGHPTDMGMLQCRVARRTLASDIFLQYCKWTARNHSGEVLYRVEKGLFEEILPYASQPHPERIQQVS